MSIAAVSSGSSGDGGIGTSNDSGGCGGTSCGVGVVATVMPLLAFILVMVMVPLVLVILLSRGIVGMNGVSPSPVSAPPQPPPILPCCWFGSALQEHRSTPRVDPSWPRALPTPLLQKAYRIQL